MTTAPYLAAAIRRAALPIAVTYAAPGDHERASFADGFCICSDAAPWVHAETAAEATAAYFATVERMEGVR
jgi:hypothetical protein